MLVKKESLSEYDGYRLTFVTPDQKPLTWDDVLCLWQQDREFRSWFSQMLADCFYPAFFWETPPLMRSHLHHSFACVLINSPELASSRTDYSPFARYLQAAPNQPPIRVFPNLGSDATLIAPCPIGDAANYAHLAAFLRGAPDDLIQNLWSTVAENVRLHLQKTPETPLWVSTSGLGVAWLHVRLDEAPKYYQYAPYKTL